MNQLQRCNNFIQKLASTCHSVSQTCQIQTRTEPSFGPKLLGGIQQSGLSPFEELQSDFTN